MIRPHCSGEKLGAQHVEVIGEGEDFGLGVEVLNIGLEYRTGGDAQGLVLNTLKFFDVGFGGGGVPDWSGI